MKTRTLRSGAGMTDGLFLTSSCGMGNRILRTHPGLGASAAPAIWTAPRVRSSSQSLCLPLPFVVGNPGNYHGVPMRGSLPSPSRYRRTFPQPGAQDLPGQTEVDHPGGVGRDVVGVVRETEAIDGEMPMTAEFDRVRCKDSRREPGSTSCSIVRPLDLLLLRLRSAIRAFSVPGPAQGPGLRRNSQAQIFGR